MREIILPQDESAKRLENYLKKQFPIGYVRKVFRKSGVRVNGQRAKPNDVIGAGDRIQLYIPFEANADDHPSRRTFAPKSTYFLKTHPLLVINKPDGIAVHEGKTDRKPETLLGVLESRYRAAGIKPMLVHRLDKDTSGVLLVAKNSHSAKELEGCLNPAKSKNAISAWSSADCNTTRARLTFHFLAGKAIRFAPLPAIEW